MDVDVLRRLRRGEALGATGELGIPPEHVYFLDFPDSRLGSCSSAAVDRTVALLHQLHPEEVYVPYRRDGTPDHEATYRIVLEAVGRIGTSITVLEYPLWLWNQVPWVPLTLEPNRDTLSRLCRAIGLRFGFHLFREFGSGVRIEAVVEKKRKALGHYRSQMTALRTDVVWPTLPDVSGGKFLECFFQKFEIFRASEPPL
jgi:LmbE family N-acetylglucosaminyl deacetylase